MVPLPQEYFSSNNKLLKKAKELLTDKEQLSQILKITDPTHSIGQLVATALFLITKKLKASRNLSYNFISEIQKYWIPLSSNFGMWKTRYFFEDTLFKLLDKENHNLILSLVKKKKHVQEKIFSDIFTILSHHLQQAIIENFEIVCRQKNIYGIFEKMKLKKKNINHITDFFAFRILVKSTDECYRALEILHKLWPHYRNRFKDYIKKPKPNHYQALHSTVHCIDCNVVEFQIRTYKMDYIAKYGEANHAIYKKLIKKSN